MTLYFCCLVGCTPKDPVLIENAWIRPPAGMHDHTQEASTAPLRTAAYLTMHNNTPHQERLKGVSSPLADTVEIHRSWTDDKGVMRMHPLHSVDIPPHEDVVFKPGGFHLMLIGVQPLQAGDTLHLAFLFESERIIDAVAVVGNMDQ